MSGAKVVLILQGASAPSDSEGDTNDDELSTLLKAPADLNAVVDVERQDEFAAQALKWAKTIHPPQQLAQRQLLDNWQGSLQRVNLLCRGVDRALRSSSGGEARAICAVYRAQTEPSLNCAAIAAKYAVLRHNLDRVAVLSDQPEACREALGGDDNFFLVEASAAGLAAMRAWGPEALVCDSQREDLLEALFGAEGFRGPVAVLVKREHAARLVRGREGLRVDEIDEAEEESTYNPKRSRTGGGPAEVKDKEEQEAEEEADEEARTPGTADSSGKKRPRKEAGDSDPEHVAAKSDEEKDAEAAAADAGASVHEQAVAATVGEADAADQLEDKVANVADDVAEEEDVEEGQSVTKRSRVEKESGEGDVSGEKNNENDVDQDDDDEDEDAEAGEVDILADGEEDSQEGSGREGVDLALDYDNSERSFTEVDRPRLARPLPVAPVAFAAPAAVVLDTDELDMEEINALIGEELGSDAV